MLKGIISRDEGTCLIPYSWTSVSENIMIELVNSHLSAQVFGKPGLVNGRCVHCDSSHQHEAILGVAVQETTSKIQNSNDEPRYAKPFVMSNHQHDIIECQECSVLRADTKRGGDVEMGSHERDICEESVHPGRVLAHACLPMHVIAYPLSMKFRSRCGSFDSMSWSSYSVHAQGADGILRKSQLKSVGE